MFADETKVFTHIKGPDDQQQLQDDIDSLVVVLWSRACQLRFNTKTCKVLHNGNSNSRYEYTVMPNDSVKQDPWRVTLEVIECEKDLGVSVDPELTFSKHIKV